MRQSYFTSFCLLSLLFACAWPHRPFPLALTFSPLTGLQFFCSFTLIFPPSALSISGLCLCTALRDQIRFTPGLNVCSHGLLHLKGNSFSWNIGVQFETRLMLANFTPLSCKMFPLLHTSIADGKRAHATL